MASPGLLDNMPQSKHHMRAAFRGFLFLGLAVYALLISTTSVVEIDAAGEIVAPTLGSRHLLQDAPTAAPTANLDADYSYQCEMTGKPPDYVPVGRGLFTCDELENGAILLLVVGVLYMFMCLAIICDEFFVPSLEVMAERWEISDDIAGATLMAAGGSAPELFTSFIGVFLAKSNVGFGTIVGSAVFNVLFVIGCCVIFSTDELVLTKWPLGRDVTYYIFSLCMLGLFFAVITPEVIELWESLVLLALYFVYVGVMSQNAKLHQWAIDKFGDFDHNGHAHIGGHHADVTDSTEMATAQSEDALGSRGEQKTPLTRRKTVMFQKKKGINLATFRAGVLEYLIKNNGVKSVAGVRLVNEIEGDMKETFHKIARKTNFAGSKEDAINKQELQEVLNIITDTVVAASEVTAVFDELDQDHSGYVEYTEFQTWYKASELKVKEQCQRAFRVIDKNKDGKIDDDEFEQMVHLVTNGQATTDLLHNAKADLYQNGNAVTLPIFTQWVQDNNITGLAVVEDKKEDDKERCFPEFPDETSSRIFYILVFPIFFICFSTIPNVQRESHKNYFALSFFMSIMWIGVSSYFMVWWATQIGDVAGIPPEVMGLTFLAAGTSVPDLLSSVIVAKQGKGDMAVSSSIGSNIFDILVGLPLPWFVYNIAFYSEGGIEVAANGLPLSLLILILMLGGVLGLIIYNGWKMTKCLGYSMFVLYALFLIQFLLQEYA